MQGTLNEIDIRSILQLVELGQRTGELFVEPFATHQFGQNSLFPLATPSTLGRASAPPDYRDPPCWFVFFSNGQIVYASDNPNRLQRLADYLRRYSVVLSPQQLAAMLQTQSAQVNLVPAPEYGCLWTLMDQKVITPTQGRNILQGMIRETLFDLLSLHHGKFVFEQSPALSPQLVGLSISPLLGKIMKQVQQWKQLQPDIQSPSQCPIILNPEHLQAKLKPTTFRILEQYSTGNISLRQISRYLNRDVATVGRAICPHLQQGWMQLVEDRSAVWPKSSTVSKGASEVSVSPHIVCIDDGASIRETVDVILREQGYRSTPLADPVAALSAVFGLNPDLILCDIAMPELDGYELCAMLRQSASFRQIPIIMLTGKDGFIDRVRARSVGATDYLTKPFRAEELLTLVEKYVGPGYPEEYPTFQHLVDLLDSTLGGGLRKE